MAQKFQDICNGIKNAIYDESGIVGKAFGEYEKRTGRRRTGAACFLLCLTNLVLVYAHSVAELWCNLICFGYPAMKTLAEMESNEKSKRKQWMFYWVIFGLFTITDVFAYSINHIFPLYWQLKWIFFLWLFMPTCLGAAALYEKFLQSHYNHILFGSATPAEMTTE
ncbi:Receptor expression-enhancing protein 5 [Trichinella britovi]|uniref:Receptor expression-enhancing protein n=2 Tax=Trichinella TaxID=6333 RepID=A0A0V1CWB5_TRIBR|nr:Receptor expression-enhancing protein 5 [Trichinella murrelli]KRY53442.1 Receptor expression-enhancing protein 5 [Trichinella britovi]